MLTLGLKTPYEEVFGPPQNTLWNTELQEGIGRPG